MFKRNGKNAITFRTQLFYRLFPIVLLPIIAVSVFSYIISLNALQTRASGDVQRITDLVSENLDYTLKSVVQLSKLVLYDPDVEDILAQYAENTEVQYVEPMDDEKINVFLRKLMIGNEFIRSVYIYTKGNAYFRQSLFNDLPEAGWKDKSWYNDALNANDSFIIIPTHRVLQNQDGGSNSKTSEFTIARQIKNVSNKYVNDFEVVGVITINMDLSAIKNIISISKVDNNTLFAIFDRKGNLIFPAETDVDYNEIGSLGSLQDTVRQGKKEYSYKNSKYLLYSSNSLYTGWTIVAIIPKSILAKGIESIKWTTFVIIAVTMLLTIGLFIFLITGISKPVIILRNLMQKVEKGDLNVTYECSGNGEIVKLGANFNQMISRLKQLIKDNYQAKIQKQRAELAALQSQINPHFIYNTLESFQMIAITENSDRLARMSYSLGQLMRYTLTAEEYVNLEEEIAHIRNYLILIKERYEDRLNYEINVSEELYSFKVPKLTLQPLVENAIYHGIDPKIGSGMVTLNIYCNTSCMLIEILDNGVGITEEKLRELRKKLELEEDILEKKQHIGIFNIQARLKRIYGSDYGISIDSSAVTGTRVTVLLPLG